MSKELASNFYVIDARLNFSTAPLPTSEEAERLKEKLQGLAQDGTVYLAVDEQGVSEIQAQNLLDNHITVEDLRR